MKNHARHARAFTVTELLIVIAIIVLLIAIAVPAFSNLISSSERAQAENQLKFALSAGRDAAIQSEAGDGAVVFLYDPARQRMTMVACVCVGQVMDSTNPALPTSSAANPQIQRDVFVALPGVEPMQMPRGWGIRAYADKSSVFAATGGSAERWYESYFSSATASDGYGGWLFPETGFFSDATSADRDKGSWRQSFMVRFKVGSGEVDIANRSTALFFDPIPSAGFRSVQPLTDYRSDQLAIKQSGTFKVSPNAQTYVRRVLQGNVPGNPNAGPKQQLLGDKSLDTVLVRPVTELALYQETHLAAGVRASRLNKETGTLYGPGVPTFPQIDASLLLPGRNTAAAFSEDVAEWITGGRNTPAAVADKITYDARVFTLTRYLGQMQEVMP